MASERANLLIEIGVEELPPGSLRELARAFAATLAEGLFAAGVVAAADDFRYFATPRRLAALLPGVSARQPSRVVERRGPALQVAFDAHGKPSRAAEGFAKSCGVEVAQLDAMENERGGWLVYRQRVAGLPLATIVTDCLAHSVRQLPIAKRMRWGDSAVEFVRPVHWLVALHGAEQVETQVLGLQAGRRTRGHRFHADGDGGSDLSLANADEYPALLESASRVIADFDARRGRIEAQLARLAKWPEYPDAQVVIDSDLLARVTAMVEWPRALRGAFDRRFLKLPAEVLISCMRDHQQYFHLIDGRGKLLPGFIAVSNLAGRAGERVRRGNERVLRARLADAEFFWESDRKIPLEAHAAGLAGVLFHSQLGSLEDKAARMARLAEFVAAQVGADGEKAARAATLCKADLVTDMVGEFPRLQGTMGRHYARKAGEDRQVADALEQHYWPRHAGDDLPRSRLAQIVALADRLDSLIGLFAVGEIPSGDKDPFALRRAALGVLRILIEKHLALDLRELLQAAGDGYANAAAGAADAPTVERVFAFMLERLQAYYQPMGYRLAELNAVMACTPTKPLDFHHRLCALSRFFTDQPEAAEALAAANKRIANILDKCSETPPARHDESLLQSEAERALARQLDQVGASVRKNLAKNRYDHGLKALSRLKQPVDSFFDEVMVMHEDAALRANRLALLQGVRRLFLGVADFSCLGGER